MNVKLGGIYKCNLGGIWKVEGHGEYDRKKFRCRAIASWMDDIVYRRNESGPVRLDIGCYFDFESSGRYDVESPFYFIKEIEP